jgi:histidinol-phosphatase
MPTETTKQSGQSGESGPPEQTDQAKQTEHPEHMISPDLAFALSLADTADAVAMQHFRSRSLVIETKPDLSEVTIADRDTEESLRQRILSERPGDGIFGEEHGSIESTNGDRWIIDPIDGTGNYVRGVPMWATLIARERMGVLDIGVVSAPAMQSRWWAEKGSGAYADGRRIRVSAVSNPADAFVSYSEGPWEKHNMRNGVELLRSQAYRQRSFGDFWQHMLVAEGACDVAAEPIVSLWDLAPIQVIVAEAGGTFTDLLGSARADGGSALSTNGVLHDAVLQILRHA